MKLLFAGIKRKEHYSPNHRKNDALILRKTAEELKQLGIESILYTEDEFLSARIDADVIFTMGRSFATLNKLEDLEKNGVVVINSTKSTYNCHRVSMIQKLTEAGVTIPKSVVVRTDSQIQYKRSVVGGNKIWLKRGDVHAIHREDVTVAYSDEQVNFVLSEFKLRGITNAILQKHVEGDVVKFYSVRGTEFFYWYYSDAQHKYEFDLKKLKDLANKSAEAMELLIYGGDAIIEQDGKITIIDINDWPSFAPIRNEASKYIAQIIYSKAKELTETKNIAGYTKEYSSL